MFKFRKNDHPDIYKFCLNKLSEALIEQKELLKSQNPDIEIISPTPVVAEIDTTKDTD